MSNEIQGHNSAQSYEADRDRYASGALCQGVTSKKGQFGKKEKK